jgi:diguanylate cyclase (GGDEF)-like protein
MSSSPADVVSAQGFARAGRGRALTAPAAVYLLLVIAAAALLSAPYHHYSISQTDWLVFVVLGACAAAAQLLVVQTPEHQAYYSTAVFFLAAALLLPPPLVALIVVIAHLPEWARHRYPWYIQTFNIANYTCATVGAALACRALIGPDHSFDGRLGRLAITGAVAALVFVFVNHALLAQMLRLARGKSYRESGLFTFTSLSTELVLALLGVGSAAVWELAPPLVPFVLVPLVVVHRSLELPSLQMAARLDAKTELFNARYFASALASELERAKRFGRPLSILLADLDLLREVNNTYGHLAGDAVLRGVASVLRAELRPFDIAGRFGGEEFAVALPEVGHEEAIQIAERIRKTVARTPFAAAGGDAVRATLSLGVATYPDNDSVDELIHQADLALYRSKALGRNRVSGAATLAAVRPEPPSAVPEPSPEPDRVVTEPAEPEAAPVPQRHVRVVEFVGAIAIAAGLLVGFSLPGAAHEIARMPWPFVLFLGLTVGLQMMATGIHGRGTDAASTVGIVGAAFVLGPKAAIVVALTAAAAHAVRRRGKPYRTVFDLADFALSAAAAGFVFESLGGSDASVGVGFVIGLAAGVAFKAVNVGLLCLAMSLEEGVPVPAIFRERFHWAVPHYLTFGPLAYATALAYDRMGLLGLATFAVPPVLLALSMRQYLDRTRSSVEEVQRVNEQLEQSNERVQRTYLATIAALSRSIAAKDDYSGGHVERVRLLAVALARTLGYRGDDLDAIEVGALLHDIGKIGVPEHILNKPAPLSDEEWEEMKRHPVTSDYILSGIELHPFVRQIVRSSHERIDGKGYPDGLAGEEIPLPARIVLVADAFDAIVNDRPYRGARPVPDVLEELRAHAGSQFCPTVLGALETIWRDRPETLAGAKAHLRAVS